MPAGARLPDLTRTLLASLSGAGRGVAIRASLTALLILSATVSAGAQSADAPVSAYQIQKMQEMLISLGYDPGPADGVPGTRTVAAVSAFQQRMGLGQTGRLDLPHYRALAAQVAALSVERPASIPASAPAISAETIRETAASNAATSNTGAGSSAVNPAIVAGTKWEITDEKGARQTLAFVSGGTVAETATPSFWKWRVEGDRLILEFDNDAGGWVRRVGRFTGPTAMSGTAESSRNLKWTWTAVRRN